MSVEKTYSITIEYEKDNVGQTGKRRGADGAFEDYTIGALSESDDAYTELQKVVLKRIQSVVPVSQGVNSAHISGTVSET